MTSVLCSNNFYMPPLTRGPYGLESLTGIYLTAHTGQTLSSKRLTRIVHILSPETDNCPFWISRRERMTIENISRSISTKEWCWPGGGRTCNLLTTSRAHIQLSHRDRHHRTCWGGVFDDISGIIFLFSSLRINAGFQKIRIVQRLLS